MKAYLYVKKPSCPKMSMGSGSKDDRPRLYGKGVAFRKLEGKKDVTREHVTVMSYGCAREETIEYSQDTCAIKIMNIEVLQEEG